MKSLSSQEMRHVQEFLAPPRIAVVATIGRTGMPQLTPNWYVYQDGKMAISTTKERVKYGNLTRDPRLAVCVYSDAEAREYMTVLGPTEIRDDETIWPVTQAIVERYMASRLVASRMRKLRTENRVIIDMSIERMFYREMMTRTR